MKIIIDSNVIISAAFWGGIPKKVIEMVFNKSVESVISEGIIKEYRKTFFGAALEYSDKAPRFSLDSIIAASKIISPHTHVDICRDPTDNKFLECAIDGKCIYIVSGDNDLLVLKEYEGIKIMTVKQFLDNFGDG